jgi:hypothetical protein
MKRARWLSETITPGETPGDRRRKQITKVQILQGARSRKQEKRIAAMVGARRLPASGAMLASKHRQKSAGGDMTSGDFHIEHKMTERKSLAIQYEWLERVTEEAQRINRDPALILTFMPDAAYAHGGVSPNMRPQKDWMLVPVRVLKRLGVLPADDDGGSK